MEIKFSNSKDVPKLPKFNGYRNDLGLQYYIYIDVPSRGVVFGGHVVSEKSRARRYVAIAVCIRLW